MMVAHSFRGEVFGSAQRLHGAMYAVDATFRREGLCADSIVDIGRAAAALHAVIDEINYRNLDDEAAFAGLTTPPDQSTEVGAVPVTDQPPQSFSGRYRKYKPSSVGRIRPLPCRPDATAASWSLRSGSGLHMPRRRLSRSRHTVGRSPPPDRLRRQAGGGTRAPLPVRPAPDRRSREVRPAPPPTAPPRAAPHGLRSRAG
jgi:hypothetical protein